jgi:hypothetical protein
VVGQPILKAIGMPGDFLQLFVGLNLMAAAVPVESRKGRWVLPAILLAAVLIRIWSLLADHVVLSTAGLVLWTGIALYAMIGALRFVLRSPSITFQHIYAALSAYLLVGVFLGELYWSLQHR